MAKKDNIKLLGKRVGYWGREYRVFCGLSTLFNGGLIAQICVTHCILQF